MNLIVTGRLCAVFSELEWQDAECMSRDFCYRNRSALS